MGLLLAILIFVLTLSSAGAAMAFGRGPRPPASFCVNAGGGGTWALSTKAGTNIKMADGVEKFYSVLGAIIVPGSLFMPLAGSGYLEGAKTGTAYVYISFSGNHAYSLSKVSCTNYEILYGQESEGSPYAPPNQ